MGSTATFHAARRRKQHGNNDESVRSVRGGLENEGVTHIFGVPGEENLDFVNSLRGSGIELVVTRHEQPAAFMAATYGRLTGRPGVCLSTLGPGALNLVTGAAYALLGAMPMILITGQKPILSSRQARFQVVDIVSTMRPLTKHSQADCQCGEHSGSVVRDAFRMATEERLGPVHLELPEDIAREMTEQTALIPSHSVDCAGGVGRGAGGGGGNDSPRRAAAGHAGGRGQPGASGGAAFGVREAAGMPFFNTQMGKGAVTGCLRALCRHRGAFGARLYS